MAKYLINYETAQKLWADILHAWKLQYVIDDNYLVKLFEYDIILNVKNLTVSNASNAEKRVCNGVVCI